MDRKMSEIPTQNKSNNASVHLHDSSLSNPRNMAFFFYVGWSKMIKRLMFILLAEWTMIEQHIFFSIGKKCEFLEVMY